MKQFVGHEAIFILLKGLEKKMPKRGKDGRPGGQLDIEGVLDEWDSTQAIRDRLRQGGRLVDTTDCTVKTCGQYSEVLGPIILRMAGGPNKVPDVSPLREEIPNLYVKNKQDKSVEHEDVIEESMIIRKMWVREDEGEKGRSFCSWLAALFDQLLKSSIVSICFPFSGLSRK